jgi:excisionase family DNA binding protein
MIQIYTQEEASQILKASSKTIYRRVRAGEIGSIKRGRRRLFTEKHLNDYIKRGEV